MHLSSFDMLMRVQGGEGVEPKTRDLSASADAVSVKRPLGCDVFGKENKKPMSHQGRIYRTTEGT